MDKIHIDIEARLEKYRRRIVASYERMIRISENDAERADLEARLEKYKRRRGV